MPPRRIAKPLKQISNNLTIDVMETSILIARILATVYFSFSLGLLLSSKYYKEELPKLVINPAYLMLGGFIAIVF